MMLRRDGVCVFVLGGGGESVDDVAGREVFIEVAGLLALDGVWRVDVQHRRLG